MVKRFPPPSLVGVVLYAAGMPVSYAQTPVPPPSPEAPVVASVVTPEAAPLPPPPFIAISPPPHVMAVPTAANPSVPGPEDPPLIRFYGVLKPTIVVAAGATESFSQPNASAITAAANPVFANTPDATNLTFQVAQSRVGVWLNEKGMLRGHVEIDFIDFTKASPTVAALPRLRIATVDFAPHKRFLLSFGQDWDLVSPLAPFGTNLVGASFQAGNMGFMRDRKSVV